MLAQYKEGLQSMSTVQNDILVDVDSAGIAVITFNRPKKRNALSLACWIRLGEICVELGKRADVRSVILTGAGGNFCAGADISEFGEVRNTVEKGRIYEAATEEATIRLRDLAKPTIAAVSGFGVGGGTGVALACDFRVGDATTRMGIPAARLGIVYGPLDCGLLLRQVGLSRAKLVLYSGRFFEIEDCKRMGLVDMAGAGSAMETARAFAADLAAMAPLSQKGAKVVLEALAAGEAEKRHKQIEEVIDVALASEDYRDAAKAFVEKKKPVFKGR